MKKSFVFSILAVLFFLLLFALALLQPTPSLGLSVGKKIVFTWDDVREDLLSLTGLTVVKEEENVTMYDQIPPSAPVVQSLQAYNTFIQDYYREKGLEIRILDSSGNPITDFDCFGKTDCDEDRVVFTIKPFNITYEYPDWGKNQLEINCRRDDDPACSFDNVRRINLTFNFSTLNFSCNPQEFNNCTDGSFNWVQYKKVFGYSACSKSEEPCLLLPYNLTFIDAQNKIYACPGVYTDDPEYTEAVNCNELVWNWYDSSSATKLTIKSEPCWMRVEFGSDGHFLIKGTNPNSNEACSFALGSISRRSCACAICFTTRRKPRKYRDPTKNRNKKQEAVDFTWQAREKLERLENSGRGR